MEGLSVVVIAALGIGMQVALAMAIMVLGGLEAIRTCKEDRKGLVIAMFYTGMGMVEFIFLSMFIGIIWILMP